MAEKMHRYGRVFWRESDDKEIFTYLEATHWFAAEREFEPYRIDGFVTGTVYYIEATDETEYVRVETVAQKQEDGDESN